MENIYHVYADLQGGNFGMYRDYNIEQWRCQAIEWCYLDDYDDVALSFVEMSDDNVLSAIEEIWSIKFRKTRKDKKVLKNKDEYNDFGSARDFYEFLFCYC